MNSLASLSESNLDHASCNDGSGKRSTEKVNVLVDGVTLDGGCCKLRTEQKTCELTVDQLLDKLSLEVFEEEARSTTLHGLFPGSLKVLLLSDISHKGDNLVTLLNEPEKDT